MKSISALYGNNKKHYDTLSYVKLSVYSTVSVYM